MLNPWLMLGLLMAFVASNLASCGRGVTIGRNEEQAKQAQIASAAAALALEREQDLRADLDAANKLNEAAGRALAQEKAEIDRLSKEKARAIRQATTGRECLSAAALSLLNGDAPGRLPGAIAAPRPGESAGTPAPEPAASDRDVADWINNARGEYAKCAAQVNGWIDWYERP